MKRATIDLTGCKTTYEFHERVMKALDFPDYYGHNWSAMWDCLTFDCTAEFITVKGLDIVSDDVKRMGTPEKFVGILDEKKTMMKNEVSSLTTKLYAVRT